MICRWRGRIDSNMLTGHLSRASGKTVWLVYAQVRLVISQAYQNKRWISYYESCCYVHHQAHFIPIESFDVYENSHQFRNGQWRVSVVQLDGHLFRERIERSANCFARTEFWRLEAANNVLREEGIQTTIQVDKTLRKQTWRVAATMKYSCFKRSSLPSKKLSLG